MSIENPYSQTFGWKVDPDNRQDRSNGPCITRMMTDEERIKYSTAVVNKEDDNKMAHMTKSTVRSLAAKGMTVEQIIEYFKPSYPKMSEKMMNAKIQLYLSDKKAGGPRGKEKGTKQEQGTVELPAGAKVNEESEKSTVAGPTSTLKTRVLEDVSSGTIFELSDEFLELIQTDRPDSISIPWDKLEAHIENLQKIKQIHEFHSA